MRVLRTITADDPFGEPWPPSSTDIWHVVRRLHGFTLWWSIQIAQSHPLSDAKDHLGGSHTDADN
jgi:hypothetical protein